VACQQWNELSCEEWKSQVKEKEHQKREVMEREKGKEWEKEWEKEREKEDDLGVD
jgi:hypothetical protein